MYKVLWIALCFGFASGSAQAANLHTGNVEVGGTIAMDFYSGGTSGFYTNPSAQYFVMDRFSLGLTGTVSTYTNSRSTYSLGPVGTVYFLDGNVAPFVSLIPIEWYLRGSGNPYYFTTVKAGVKFFFNDSVAFGPQVSLVHRHPRNGGASIDNVQVAGVFSIHL